jgi:hypothetical protein
MYKTGSFEKELFRNMEKQLMSNQLENKYSFSKIAKAADCLNAAADIFEKAGMYKEASEIIQIIKTLSK